MELPVVEMYKNICSFAAECSVISNDMWPRDWVAESEKRKVAGYVAGGQDCGFMIANRARLFALDLSCLSWADCWHVSLFCTGQERRIHHDPQ